MTKRRGWEVVGGPGRRGEPLRIHRRDETAVQKARDSKPRAELWTSTTSLECPLHSNGLPADDSQNGSGDHFLCPVRGTWPVPVPDDQRPLTTGCQLSRGSKQSNKVVLGTSPVASPDGAGQENQQQPGQQPPQEAQAAPDRPYWRQGLGHGGLRRLGLNLGLTGHQGNHSGRSWRRFGSDGDWNLSWRGSWWLRSGRHKSRGRYRCRLQATRGRRRLFGWSYGGHAGVFQEWGAWRCSKNWGCVWWWATATRQAGVGNWRG